MPNSVAAPTQSPASGYLTLWKDGLAVLRDTLLLGLAGLLLAFPEQLNHLLERAGIQEWSVAGLKWKTKLFDSDQALKDLRAAYNDVVAQNKVQTETIRTLQAASNDPKQKESAGKLEAQSARLEATAAQIDSSVSATIAANAGFVRKAGDSLGDTWAVVYGGDTTLAAASDEVGERAKQRGLDRTGVYFRQGSYRSVALAGSHESAQGLLEYTNRNHKI